MQEFKVGDRVRLEGVISRLWGDGGAAVNFTGDDQDTGINWEEMAHATLIEPKPRYDWSTIPPEYDWAATDRGGAVYAYKNKPFCKDHANFWIGKDSGDMFHICKGQLTEDWRDSLERRPEEVEAAVKVAEEKPLDLSKPMRIKVRPDVEVREVFGPSSRGFYLVDRADGILDIRLAEALENIPEPKKTVSQAIYLHEYANGRRFYTYGYVSYAALIAKARITHTSGEGWSIEEVE